MCVCTHSGLLAPRWRSDARGVMVGLTAYTNRGHIVRAMLESMCFQTREVVDAMRKDADLSHLKVLHLPTSTPTFYHVHACIHARTHGHVVRVPPKLQLPHSNCPSGSLLCTLTTTTK